MTWTSDNLGRRQNPGYNYNTNQIQVRVDPRDQLDDEISGLSKQVHQLKQVAQHIDTETRYQNKFLNQLEETVAEGRAVLKTTTQGLNRPWLNEALVLFIWQLNLLSCASSLYICTPNYSGDTSGIGMETCIVCVCNKTACFVLDLLLSSLEQLTSKF